MALCVKCNNNERVHRLRMCRSCMNERARFLHSERNKGIYQTRPCYVNEPYDGPCIRCGSNPSVDGRKICAECVRIQARTFYNNNKEKIAKQRALLFHPRSLDPCCRCDTNPREPGKRICCECKDKTAAAYKISKKLYQEQLRKIPGHYKRRYHKYRKTILNRLKSNCEEMRDSYIKDLIHAKTGISVTNITVEMIRIQREGLIIYRLLKDMREEFHVDETKKIYASCYHSARNTGR
jgi:hypothetical protein